VPWRNAGRAGLSAAKLHDGVPYPHLYHAGAARIALFTKNIDEEYARLKGLGVGVCIRAGCRSISEQGGAMIGRPPCTR
jgi:hypothetical protein